MKDVRSMGNELLIQNLERQDAEELNKRKDVQLLQTLQGPSGELPVSQTGDAEFSLAFDFDYGTDLKSDAPECLERLENDING